MRQRIIPCLLLSGAGLVKTERFKNPTYIGDPINAVRIFNEKEVDELIFLDIQATPSNLSPRLDTLRSIASECFMPLCYGGGVTTLQQIEEILKTGVEKVAVNTALVKTPGVVEEAATRFGSSTIVASIDFKRTMWRRIEAFTGGGRQASGMPPVELAKRAEDLGVGEILLTSIERDGTMTGYDIDVTRQVSDAVTVPVVASGGAGSLQHFREALDQGHASAVAAGAFFVFVGRHRAVLITYPSQADLVEHVFA
jgi:cyclase